VRLVLDTNVLIAAFVSRGVCHELLEHCQREHELITSEVILGEFESSLLTKFKVPPAAAREAAALLASRMQSVTPKALDAPICRDPDDDWVLATALVGRCECIITGDKDLLTLKQFQNIAILAPSEFWGYEASRESSAS
jgi:uncharacterized protein